MSKSKQNAASQENGINVSIQLTARGRAAPSGGPRRRLSQSPFVRLHQTESGYWEVSDDANQRGGLFRDYRSAAYYIKHEYHISQPSLVIVNGGVSDASN